ncbi:MAG: hypothetical protein QNJ15_14820 [Erythrobacter sp.]|nr:hypothetical protein [Erythrobacter sp.]
MNESNSKVRKLNTLPDFVVIRSDNANVPDAIEVMRDAGRYFAVVPKGTTRESEIISQALIDPATKELAIPTGEMLIRWGDRKDALKALLTEHRGSLIKDYGKGGIVAFAGLRDPISLADNLAEYDGILRAEPLLLRSKAFKS